MKVYIVTHGTHVKGGNDAATYDGPLTEEAKTKLSQIALPTVAAIYRGIMQRHKETAEVLGAEENLTTDQACGYDVGMFNCLNNGDTDAVTEFLKFLEARKTAGYKSILIITSRFYPIVFKYLQSGGEEKMGPFPTFCKVVETASTWEGTIMPLMQSGVMHEFQW